MKLKPSPDYDTLSYADRMGPKLRALVESQLREDLGHYGIDAASLKFDWSKSCVEGHSADHLDGTVENFSGISVFNFSDVLVADGWMEFVHEGDFFLAYWEFVTTWSDDRKLKEKKEVGIPVHIWRMIPEDFKSKYKARRL